MISKCVTDLNFIRAAARLIIDRGGRRSCARVQFGDRAERATVGRLAGRRLAREGAKNKQYGSYLFVGAPRQSQNGSPADRAR